MKNIIGKQNKQFTPDCNLPLPYFKIVKMYFQIILKTSAGGRGNKKKPQQNQNKQFPREAQHKNWSAWEGSMNYSLEKKCSLLPSCFQGQKWSLGGLCFRIFKWPNQNLVQINSLLQAYVISSFSTNYRPIEGYFAKHAKYSKIEIMK